MKQSSIVRASSRVGSIVALVAMSVVASFCKGREVPDGQCVFNSDCDDGQVCAGKVCRKPCNSRAGVSQAERDRDCQPPAGYTCRPADTTGSYACYPPDVPYRCVYHSECNQDRREICARDGFCRSQCVTDYDCFVYTLNVTSRCIITSDAGTGGTCDFRVTDGGADDAATDASDASSDSASPSDASTPSDASAG